MAIDDSIIDEKFQSFIRTGSGENELKQLYETLPYLDHDQQRTITLISNLSVKYDSQTLADLRDRILQFSKENRKTGFRFTRLIEALSLYKHFKGYKASHSTNKEDNTQ